MRTGYYWARHGVRGWRIVKVVSGLHSAVLEGGYAVNLREYSEFVGPLEPPPAEGCKQAWVMPPVVRPEFYLDPED